MCAGLDGLAVCTQAGGLPPLLELMASRNGNLQHNAAFALYGLADNEDNIAAIVREGGVQCLQDCELLVQVTSSCCAALPCLLYLHRQCVLQACAQLLLISRDHSRAISVLLSTGCASYTHWSCPGPTFAYLQGLQGSSEWKGTTGHEYIAACTCH